jgi:hypothetical protein
MARHGASTLSTIPDAHLAKFAIARKAGFPDSKRDGQRTNCPKISETDSPSPARPGRWKPATAIKQIAFAGPG